MFMIIIMIMMRCKLKEYGKTGIMIPELLHYEVTWQEKDNGRKLFLSLHSVS
jgi:hypothetical protein